MDPIMIVLLLGLVALMFFMSRSQKKRREQAEAFRKSLNPGQQIMTIGRLVGTITDVQDDVITIETTPGTQFRIMRSGIAQVIEDETEAPEEDPTPVEERAAIAPGEYGAPASAAQGTAPSDADDDAEATAEKYGTPWRLEAEDDSADSHDVADSTVDSGPGTPDRDGARDKRDEADSTDR